LTERASALLIQFFGFRIFSLGKRDKERQWRKHNQAPQISDSEFVFHLECSSWMEIVTV
jgi:hypothetical protein